MSNEDLVNDVKDMLARVEGTFFLLHHWPDPDVKQAQRKLQGLRDKLHYVLIKLTKDNEPKPKEESSALLKKIRELGKV